MSTQESFILTFWDYTEDNLVFIGQTEFDPSSNQFSRLIRCHSQQNTVRTTNEQFARKMAQDLNQSSNEAENEAESELLYVSGLSDVLKACGKTQGDCKEVRFYEMNDKDKTDKGSIAYLQSLVDAARASGEGDWSSSEE